jgi:hypothetical protein
MPKERDMFLDDEALTLEEFNRVRDCDVFHLFPFVLYSKYTRSNAFFDSLDYDFSIKEIIDGGF